MINYRLSRNVEEHIQLLTRNISDLFCEYCTETWKSSEFYKDVVCCVEEAYVDSHDKVISRGTGEEVRPRDLGQGVQSLILAYNGIGVFKASSFGENLLPFFRYFRDEHDIYLVGDTNLFGLWDLLDLEDNFPGVYIENTNTCVFSYEELEDQLTIWEASQTPHAVNVRHVLDGNQKLDKLLTLSAPGEFFISLNYKVTFIDAPASSGKSYLFKRLLDYFKDSCDVYIELPRTLTEVYLSSGMVTTVPKVILIDLDAMPGSILDFLQIFDAPEGIHFIVAGHGVSCKIRTPFESIYRVSFDRYRGCFSLWTLKSPKNPVLDKYKSLVTEDTGSGYALYLTIMKSPLDGIAAGGYGRVPQSLKLVNKNDHTLVVVDYATSVRIIDTLCKEQEDRKAMDILLQTSAEYAIAYSCGKEREFEDALEKIQSMSEPEVRTRLKSLKKNEVNTETIDLLAAYEVFSDVGTSNLKRFELLRKHNPDPTLLRSFIHQEVSRYRADSTQQLPAASDNSDTGTTNHFGG